MRILLRLPNWLGDGVMVTPSIDLIKSHFPDSTLSIIATKAVCELFKDDIRIDHIYIDSTKQAKSRFLATIKLGREIGRHDIAITFANHFYSALLLYCTRSTMRIGYKGFMRGLLFTHTLVHTKILHQVLSYANLLTPLFTLDSAKVGDLSLYIPESSHTFKIPALSATFRATSRQRGLLIIGLNPGAARGGAKRWLKEYFALVARYFLTQSHIVLLFGGYDDISTCNEIESMINDKSLLESNLAHIDSSLSANTTLDSNIAKYALADNIPESNLINLCGKTTLQELVSTISALDVFITNDSGPMHIATALKVNTIALYGSTGNTIGAPWHSHNTIGLYENLACSPCFKRECPLVHHHCMKLLTPDKVIKAIHTLLDKEER